jgi:hypothetical protein
MLCNQKPFCPTNIVSAMSQGHDDDWSGQHYRDTQVVTIVLMLSPDGESPSDCDM